MKFAIFHISGKRLPYLGVSFWCSTNAQNNVPVLYVPYFSHPDPSVNKKSGLLMPSITSDDSLGASISIPFFYNISLNKDLTITPNIYTKADNYFNLNYRYLSKNHLMNINSSITDNESKQGTKNHIFINGDVTNPYGMFSYKIETANIK